MMVPQQESVKNPEAVEDNEVDSVLMEEKEGVYLEGNCILERQEAVRANEVDLLKPKEGSEAQAGEDVARCDHAVSILIIYIS